MVLVNFSVFLLGVFVLFVGASASDSPSSFPFLSLIFLLFLPLLSFFFCFGLYLFLFLLFFSSCFFFFSFASFSSSPMLFLICSSFLSCFFACISFDCSCCCSSCVYSSSFSSCVSSSPQAPARTWKGKMETTSISFCLPFGELCEIVLSKNSVCSFGGFLSSTEHVFVSCSWNMFEGVRDSLLLLISCLGFV